MKHLLTTVVVGLAGIQGVTLAAESRPKLVVGIVVDQLRTDYLENLKDMLSPGGFKRLMEQGVYLKDVDFGVIPADATSATAIIQTGTYPRYNGVTGSMVYDPVTKSVKPILSDDAFIGNFTTETYSPAYLRVSTLTDELTVEEKGKTRIHSIAPDAAQAIVLAGHTGNSAFWVNDETGRWASSTYFPNPPAALQNRNYNSPLVSRLDTMRWMPLRKNEPYPLVNPEEIAKGFRYTFSRSDRDVYSHYKHSPYFNADVTSAATEYISDLSLGRNGENTDVLNIAYTLAPYPEAGEDYRYTLEDAYLRLDKNLENLFSVLDRQIGRENILIYLVSTGYFAEPSIDYKPYRLPGGTFSVKRAMSLLNSYLAAKYGNGSYVDRFHNRHLYLSKSVLEEKNLDLNSVAEDARDFLVRMSGVEDAYTVAELLSPILPHIEDERLSLDPKSAGDIILIFNPGWEIIDDTIFPAVARENKNATYDTPAFIAGGGINPKVIEETVEATAIAPTIAKSLRIRAPNSSMSKPIRL